jgi:hypothetical protein
LENSRSNTSFSEYIKSNNELSNQQKCHPLSVEYLTGENLGIKKNSACANQEKKLSTNENRSVESHESVSNICTLIDSVKINFLKLESTLQNEIGNNIIT